MEEKCPCGMPLDEKSKCKCQPNLCYHCCTCEMGCSCGCKEKENKEK